MAGVVERVARFRDRLVTPDAVYGTVLFAAVVAATSDDGEHAAGPLEILVTAGLTLVVFCIAHIYARTIATHGVRRGEDVPLGTAFRRAVRASLGMLWAVVPSVVVLLLGVFGAIEESDDWALWVAVVVLGLLGYQAFAERGSRVWARILGGVVTAVIGVVVIVLDLLVH